MVGRHYLGHKWPKSVERHLWTFPDVGKGVQFAYVIYEWSLSCDGNQISCSVIEAKNLIPMDMNGKSDPYVVVKIVGSSSKETKVIKKTLDPTWNETLTIDLKPEDKYKRLLVECWDQDTLSADDFMGRMSFGISENMAQDGWFKFLTVDEGEFYNVPVPAEGEDLTNKLKKMRVCL